MTAPSRSVRQKPRRPWRIVLRLAVAAVLLAVVFAKVDFGRFGRAFVGISPWSIVAAYLLYVASLVFKAFRWKQIGLTHPEATVLDCFSATATGFLFGLLAPGMFDFTRAHVLKRRARVPFGSVAGIIVAERALDTVLLLIVTFFVLVLVPGARWLSTVAAALAALVAIGLGLLALLVWSRTTLVPRIERVLGRVSPALAKRVARFLETFADGIHRLGELKAEEIYTAMGFSVLLWGCRALYILLVVQSLGVHVAFGLALFLAAVENLGMLVKLTPAGIGQYQVMIVAVLMAFGVDQSRAVLASLVLHAVRLLVIFSLGIPFLYRENLGLSRLTEEKAAAGERTTLSGGAGPG